MRHQPAFAGQIKELFRLQPGDIFYDLTLGDGGHSQEALAAGARVISFDVDEAAISRATNFLSGKFTPVIVRPEMVVAIPTDFCWLIIHANFAKVGEVAAKFKLPKANAILADLGTSQYQLTEAQRGFSFNLEGPLDMRLDGRLGLTAADLVNALSERELTELLLLADEYQARSIARAIVTARKIAPLRTTGQLAKIVTQVKKAKPGKINPATKTFMALRLAVNLEREALRDMLVAAPDLLTPGGILGVISFHSGEDRLVKRFIKEKKKAGILRVINVKPLKPNENELQINPKVRSAKLRLAQKT